MNNLKLRANYGETGNGTSPYQVFDTWIYGNPFNQYPQLFNSSRYLILQDYVIKTLNQKSQKRLKLVWKEFS